MRNNRNNNASNWRIASLVSGAGTLGGGITIATTHSPNLIPILIVTTIASAIATTAFAVRYTDAMRRENQAVAPENPYATTQDLEQNLEIAQTTARTESSDQPPITATSSRPLTSTDLSMTR